MHLGDGGGGAMGDGEDLYSGYNDFSPALATDDLELDQGFQTSARTLDSRRPTALTPNTPFGLASRLGTAAGVGLIAHLQHSTI